MELEGIIGAVEVDHAELIVALTAMRGAEPETHPPGMEVIPADEALQPLEESMDQLDAQIFNFMIKAFQQTSKTLTKEKKDNLVILSPSLIGLKKEFRLPNRADLKPKEGRDAQEAWVDFRNSYHQLAHVLTTATLDLGNGSSTEVSETLKWSNFDVQRGSKLILQATIRLLLGGILVRSLYSSVLTKAQIEFAHRSYNLAFEALNKYKVSQKLRTARRQARNSPEKQEKALELLEEEEARFQEVEEKWDREAGLWERWRRESGDVSQHTFLEKQKQLNRELGVHFIEGILLPAVTEKVIDIVLEITDFIPKPEQFETLLPNHEQEAEEIAESIGDDLSKIRENLEVKESPRSEEGSTYSHSTPRGKAVSFSERLDQSILSHSITSLSRMVSKLGKVYAQAKETTNEVNLEILKATLKAAERKAISIDLKSGSSGEISEACTLTDKLDELSIEVAAFVSLQEKRDRRIREEEKSRDIMMSKALPAGKIPTFNGNREDYFEWATLFQAQCPPSISSVMRANHLRQALKDPITQNLIKGCQTAEEIERILKQHFGNKNEELARLLAQIDNIPVPKNRPEEFGNIQELKKLHRKLKVLGEETTIDKIRLTKLVHDIFLQSTKEEFEKILYEKRDELIQEYSLNYGIVEDAARDLALGEMTKELEISKEDYSAIFWKFLDKKADVGGRMRGAASATGLLMGAPKQTGNFRSNMIDPPTEFYNAQPYRGPVRRCAFKNCGSADHYAFACPILKPEEMPQDIQQLCLNAGVCMRCLRELSYRRHNETCQGYYKRRTDNKWIYTDCHTCTVTLPNGNRENINKRICQHAIDRAKANQDQSLRLSPLPTVNSFGIRDSRREYDAWIPHPLIRSSTSIPIANKLVVNDQFCGEASQLVEWINVQGRYEGFQALTMFDLGTSCSVIDVKLADEAGLQWEEVHFTISTVSGKQEGSRLYTLYLLDNNDRSVKVQALGVDIKQYYPRIKVGVRNSWIKYFKGQSFQTAKGGQLGLLLGSDQSILHPRQVAFERNEILWRSWLTNRYLITGGRNEQARISSDGLGNLLSRKNEFGANIITEIGVVKGDFVVGDAKKKRDGSKGIASTQPASVTIKELLEHKRKKEEEKQKNEEELRNNVSGDCNSILLELGNAKEELELCRLQLKKAQEEKVSINENQNTNHHKYATLQKNNEELLRKLEYVQTEKRAAVEKAKEAEGMMQEMGKVMNEGNKNNQDSKNLLKMVEQLQQQLETQKTVLETYEPKYRALDKLAKDLHKKNKQMKVDVANAELSKQQMQNEVTESTKMLETAKNELEEWKSLSDLLQSQLNEKSLSADTLEKEVATLKTGIKNSKLSLEEKEENKLETRSKEGGEDGSGGLSLVGYIDKEENEAVVRKDRLPPINELVGEDEGENDSGQLEVNDEPIQREGIPQDLDSEESLEEKEKNFSELIEGTEANEDTKEAGAIETDLSEQPLPQIISSNRKSGPSSKRVISGLLCLSLEYALPSIGSYFLCEILDA